MDARRKLLNIAQINFHYVEVWFREARKPSPHGVVFFEKKCVQDIAAPQNHQKVVSLDVELLTLHAPMHPGGVPTMTNGIFSLSIFHTVYNKYIRLSDRVAQCLECFGIARYSSVSK